LGGIAIEQVKVEVLPQLLQNRLFDVVFGDKVRHIEFQPEHEKKGCVVPVCRAARLHHSACVSAAESPIIRGGNCRSRLSIESFPEIRRDNSIFLVAFSISFFLMSFRLISNIGSTTRRNSCIKRSSGK